MAQNSETSEPAIKQEQEIVRVIEQEAVPAAERQISQWKMIDTELTRYTASVTLLKRPDGKSLAHMRRRRDHTIETSGMSSENGLPLYLHRKKTEERIRAEVAAAVYRACPEGLITRDVAKAAMKTGSEINLAVRKATKDLMRRSLPLSIYVQGRERGGTTPMDAGTWYGRIAHQYALPLSDVEDARRLTGIYEPGIPVDKYNLIRTAAKSIEELRQTSPAVAKIFIMLIKKGMAAPARHPGQIVQQTKEFLNLPQPQWRELARCNELHELIEYSCGGKGPNDVKRAVAICTKAAAEANCPGAPQHVREIIYSMTDNHRIVELKEVRPGSEHWQDGDPWRAWMRVLNQGVAAYREDLPRDEQFDRVNAFAIAAALTGHVGQERPWGPTGWDGYVERARRWEQEQQALRERRMNRPKPKAEDYEWTSEVGQFTCGGYTVTPVTTQKEMTELGEQMMNCIGNYAERCHQGGTKIFKIEHTDTKRLAGAVEVFRKEGAWHQGQLEARCRQATTKGAKQAAAEAVKRYNEATAAPTPDNVE